LKSIARNFTEIRLPPNSASLKISQTDQYGYHLFNLVELESDYLIIICVNRSICKSQTVALHTAFASNSNTKNMANKKSSMDPLDVIIAVLAILIGFTIFSWYAGYGPYVTAIVVVLVSYAYMKAPRRSYPTAAKIAETANLRGKVALVTGSTSGIGVETARVLALGGAHVYIVARNPKKLETTKAELLKSLPQGSQISTLTCDLADLKSVKACAETFLKQESELHILINNAGIMALPERTPTKQNLESQVGVCHVGHFYLTKLLLPVLEKAATKELPARVVALSSVAHRNHNIAQLLTTSPQLETTPYDADVGYGNAKACNLLFAHEFHKKHYDTKSIAAFSVMPGGIFTGLQGHVHPWKMFKWTVMGPFFFKSIEQGAATSMVCALTADPDADGGEYFDNCKVVTGACAKVSSEAGGNEDAGARLWEITEKLLSNLGF
jgi:NAD(P)-dependent dehydrogenase (short-subunit alcohol dehydrogenase family)